MSKISRRHFLKIGAAGTATAILAGCSQETERWVELEPYVRAPEEQLAGTPTWYATTCRMCPAACGVIVRVMSGRAVKLEGNPEHPVNRGKLCARGQAGLQLLYNPDRVTGAVRQAQRGSRQFEPIAWNDALNTLYEKIEAAGNAVAVWTGSTTSGHLYDLFARFQAAIGAPPPLRYDLYSGLNGYGVLASVNGALFDRAALPTYDLGQADIIFSFGADFAGTWLSSTGFGVEFGRFRSQEFGKRGFFVQFEPRMSAIGAKADRWIPIRPGSEALVAQAILRIIAEEGFGSSERAQRAAKLAGEVDIEAAAAACEMEIEELVTLAREFAQAERPIALPGSALTGQPDAQAAVMAVQALNALADVGEAGRMAFTPAPPAEGLTPPPASTYADALALLEKMRAGAIKVLLVHGANPLYDLPEAADVRGALENVETIVSFNPLVDETAAYADYILPDRVYLEGWGYEVVQPSFGGLPAVSGQQPVVEPLHDVRPTGDVLLTVARGIPAAAEALPWTDEVAFIQEQIAKLPKGAAGGEDEAVRWARFQQHGGWWPEEAPPAESVRAKLQKLAAPEAVYQGDAEEYPFYLYPYFSVLLGDGGGAGANTPWLQGVPDPLTTISWHTWAEINPITAKKLGLGNGDIVKITSPHGEIEVPVYQFPAIRPDTIAIPLGQGHEDLGRYAKARGQNPLALVGAEADASGTSLAWANVRVKITATGEHRKLAVLESRVDAEEAGGEMHIPF